MIAFNENESPRQQDAIAPPDASDQRRMVGCARVLIVLVWVAVLSFVAFLISRVIR